jgi:hypothetical protein
VFVFKELFESDGEVVREVQAKFTVKGGEQRHQSYLSVHVNAVVQATNQ